MPRSSNQKLKLLYLAKIFLENTDASHALTLKELSSQLAKYEISAERKSLYDDIELLRVYGLDVCVIRDRQVKYYVSAHTFEPSELKVLADVGLVGFPNAGKSTLLSVVSAAKPKIANYAFTTLEPNLGIVSVRDDHSFVMADIPGIIEGAHEGRGLGTRFLRHIERNSVLLFMIPADSDDIVADYEILLGELTQYNPELLDKQRLLAITKCDMLDDELIEQMRSHLPEGIQSIFISSVANMNITQLKDMLWRALQE
jgi:ribosome-interacting GTPase 1